MQQKRVENKFVEFGGKNVLHLTR
uniref:Uncharacterized protein n=1 Tax=Arundo donax TaxID=35708 RepID=A0A0A9GYS2_ARUDO